MAASSGAEQGLGFSLSLHSPVCMGLSGLLLGVAVSACPEGFVISPLASMLKPIFSTLPSNCSFWNVISIRPHLAQGSPVPKAKPELLPDIQSSPLHHPPQPPPSLSFLKLPTTISTLQQHTALNSSRKCPALSSDHCTCFPPTQTPGGFLLMLQDPAHLLPSVWKLTWSLPPPPCSHSPLLMLL